jgi:hypothetical protein
MVRSGNRAFVVGAHQPAAGARFGSLAHHLGRSEWNFSVDHLGLRPQISQA